MTADDESGDDPGSGGGTDASSGNERETVADGRANGDTSDTDGRNPDAREHRTDSGTGGSGDDDPEDGSPENNDTQDSNAGIDDSENRDTEGNDTGIDDSGNDDASGGFLSNVKNARSQLGDAKEAFSNARGAGALPTDEEGRVRLVCRRYEERRLAPLDDKGRPTCYEADHPDCESCVEAVRDRSVETW